MAESKITIRIHSDRVDIDGSIAEKADLEQAAFYLDLLRDWFDTIGATLVVHDCRKDADDLTN